MYEKSSFIEIELSSHHISGYFYASIYMHGYTTRIENHNSASRIYIISSKYSSN